MSQRRIDQPGECSRVSVQAGVACELLQLGMLCEILYGRPRFLILYVCSGVMGSIDLSWSLNKELPYYISVYGSSGTLHVGWKESKFRRASDAEWTVFGSGYEKVQAFRAQIDNFVRSIHGLEAPLITLADALASVEVIDAAYEAMWRVAWVPIASDLSEALTAA